MRTLKIVSIGLFVSAAFTFVIFVTAGYLAGFEIVGSTRPFQYPWRLVHPTSLSHLTAWIGYLAHNIAVWIILFLAQRQKPGFENGFRWFNWAMVGTHVVFILLHLLQTRLWYDGLAADVPEITALGSVALMLMVILILETPRRGLILDARFPFRQGFLEVVRRYHGYLFSWAIVYTFWYHPTVGTIGHLAGFFYMFMLFVQSALIFNRAHLNKFWTFLLEFFVLIHALLVALAQGNSMWPMFVFGFASMFILAQMYGLGLGTWTKRLLVIGFLALAVGVYAATGRLEKIHEIARIPVLDYLVVFLLYGIYLVVAGIGRIFVPAKPSIK